MDSRSEVKEFLASRRARVTPEAAGLPAYGGNRRVKGLRREEVLPATLSAHASATLDEDEPAGLAAHGGPRSVALGMLSPA